MLSCLNLSLELQNKTIFSGLGLSLLPGSIYILKGANGSGKTSLLKIISGLIKSSNGTLLWNNKNINYEEFYENNLSYLSHENAIKHNLSVIENLLLWADLKNNHQLIYPAMSHFNLSDLADIKCKYLSAGWKKRISLARMIISNGKLWLLDEPEANLDNEGRDLLLKLLQIKIASGGMAIIASHNLEYYKNIPIINIDDFKHENN
jgi:heme exporter protein A